MCYPFFFFVRILFPCHWFASPWGTCLTWSNPRRVSFQFNQESSWLPIYRHLDFPRSVSLCQITHESKTPSWLKDIDIIHKMFGEGNAFFLLFHSRNSKLKNTKASWAGEFSDRIAFNDNLQIHLNECLSYSHVNPRFPQKQKPKKKIFPLPRKPQILKKKNLESI